MTKLYVIVETEIKGLYETSHPHVLGVTTSQDLAVTLIQKRHPTLVMEADNFPAEDGQLKFAMRGKGRASFGEDLYFCFTVSPFKSDPADLGTIIYDEEDPEGRPQEDRFEDLEMDDGA